MKKWIPAVFTALIIWNLVLTFILGNMILNNRQNQESSNADVSVSGYLTEVTDIVENVRGSTAVVTAVFEDHVNTGSAVVYASGEGMCYVFTPYSVVHGSQTQQITFDSGVTLDGYCVGEDFTTGLALVACSPGFTVKPMILGNSDTINDGEYVLALAGRKKENAAAYASFGVVSSTGMYRTSILSRIYTDLIVTDIDNSSELNGAALVNIRGELEGIVTSTPFQGSGDFTYAVGVNEIRMVYEQLRFKGSVTRANPGIVYREVSDLKVYERSHMNIPLDQVSGLLVTYVWDEGAAQHTLRAGDVLLKADGEELTNANVFRRILYSHNPGDTVDLTFLSDGEERTVSLMLK
ncbi:MAG: S1C family serine protease [Bulleidia sp.]